MRLLIVDDHIAVAESLHALLSREPGFELTPIAPDAETALRIVRETEPDVVLMDQGLPGMSGTDAVARVLEIRPATAVIMFSGSMTEDDLVTAVESGIRGYVPKGARAADVVSAVRRAAAGEILLAPDELTRLLRRSRERSRQRLERDRQVASLTPREREVLRLMAKAQDVPAISDALGITAHTARGYIQNILEKLQAHSRLEAVIRATLGGSATLFGGDTSTYRYGDSGIAVIAPTGRDSGRAERLRTLVRARLDELMRTMTATVRAFGGARWQVRAGAATWGEELGTTINLLRRAEIALSEDAERRDAA